MAEKTSIGQEEVATFSPKTMINRENTIRHLVRFASLLVLGLLIVEFIRFSNPDNEFINVLNMTSSILMFFLLPGVFLIGLFLIYFQLRWVNDSRNKTTNLGGLIGLFGLFSTLVTSLIALFVQPFPFIILVGLGLMLTIIGLFAEMTRIDEPLVFWVSVYKFLVARLFLFIIAFSIMTLGFIGWDGAIGLPLGLFLGGYVFGIVVWLRHSYFRKITTTLSGALFLWGLYLLYLSYPNLVSGDIWLSPLPLLISGLLIVIGTGENVVIWRKEIFNFLVVVKNAITQAIRATFRFIRETLRSAYLAMMKFLHYTWDHRVDILRAFLTIMGSFIIVIGFALSLNTWFYDLGGVGWGIIGGLFLYAAWFHQTNHAIYNFLVDVKNAIVQTGRSIYLSTKAFLHSTWDHRVDIVRAFLTIIGGFAVFLGFTLLISTWFVDLGGLGGMVVGCLFLYVAWLNQTNHFVKNSLITLRNAIVRTAHASYNFLVDVKNALVRTGRSAYLAIVAFLHYTWDHRVDIIRAFLTIAGPFLIIVPFFLSPLVFPQNAQIVLGIIVLNQIDLGISILLIILGFLFLYSAWFYQTNHFVKQSLIAIGNVSVRTYRRVVVFLKNTYHAVLQFLQTYYRDVITTVALGLMFLGSIVSWIFSPEAKFELPLILFLIGYVVSVAIWYKHTNFRAVTTTLSTGVFLCGFALMLTVLGSTDAIAIVISGGLVLIGVAADGLVWRVELWRFLTNTVESVVTTIRKATHASYNFLVATKNAIVQAFRAFVRSLKETYEKISRFVRTYYLEIVRYLISTVAFVLIAIGFFFWYENDLAIFLFLGGYVVGVAIWYGHPSFRSIGTILSIGIAFWGVLYFITSFQIPFSLEPIAIRISLILMFVGLAELGLLWRMEIKNVLIDVKNTIIRTFRSVFLAVLSFSHYTWDHRIDILRAFITIVGSFLVVFGLTFFFSSLFSDWGGVGGILTGSLFLYVAWFHQTNHFIKQSLIAFKDAIVRTVQAIYKFLVDVKNAIVQAIRSAYLATLAFLHYIWDHRIDILRALATLAGPLVILTAVVLPDLEVLVRMVMLLCGLGLVYIAWFGQVNHFIKQTLIAIRNVFSQAAHSIYNFLVAAKAALIQAGKAVTRFLSQALSQLSQLIVATIDSIILILSIILSISAIFYGIVLILSGLIDPSGDWTKIFLNLPILGFLIEFVAKFVQNFSLFPDISGILTAPVENLLGVWAAPDKNPPYLELIILGIPFIAPGVILAMITFLMRDSIKLSSVKDKLKKSQENN